MRSFTPLQALTLPILAALLLADAGAAEASVITSLNFASPSTIQTGGAVTIDFGINFIPTPGTLGAPEFIDNQTASPVTSCALDQNACTELQFNTTASTLTSIFAEVVAGNTPGPPNFYPFTSTGTFPLVLSYPNPGSWTITTAGADQEQFLEVECTTQWNRGAPTGSPSCSTVQTFSVEGAFNPAPQLLVTVNPPAAAPEPGSLALIAASVVAFGFWRWRNRPGYQARCRSVSGAGYPSNRSIATI